MSDPPLTVDDLTVVVAAGTRVWQGLEPACSCLAPPGRSSELAELEPDLVLVEHDELVDRTDLLAAARAAGVPSAVWITRVPGVKDPSYPEALGAADVVFATDPRLTLPGGSSPVLGLPHAAAEPALRAGAASPARTERVGVVMEAGRSWRRQFSARLDDVLRELSAAYRLSIFAPGVPASDVPGELEPLLEVGPPDGAPAFLQGCAAALVAAPAAASSLYMPATAFDAVALGRPVVAVPRISAAYALPRIVAPATGEKGAGEWLRELLRTGEVAPGRRAAGIATIRNEHTYGHRLATVASALSLPVMPRAR